MGAPQYEQAGADIGGTGTTNTIPRWTGPSTLGDSVITQSGSNIGIGTASPLAPLDVRDATVSGLGITSIYTGAITAGQGGALTFGGYFTGTSPTTWAKIVGGKDNATAGDFGGHLQFLTRPNGGSLAERARFDSAGRLLLGLSTAPSSAEIRQLVTPGSGANGGQQWASSSGGCAITPIATNGGAIFYAYSGNVGSESYATSFRATATGLDVSVAAVTPGLKLPATPGNGNANTLDSYQEGTRVLSAGDLSGWTYVTATQYWTLVGRTVTLHTVFTGGTSSATGGATIATPPLLTPLRIAAGAAVNSSGTALGNGVCVVASTSSTTGTVITSNAISSSAVDKVLTVTYETAGL